MSNGLETPAKRKRPSLRLDPQGRALLKRFMDDWIWPRWRELAVTLVLTACLAAATGGYPTVIKLSFDTLMKGDKSILPMVLAAIIGITAIRSTFLYFQSVATNRLVLRMTTDLQKKAFAHLIAADFARLSRECQRT